MSVITQVHSFVTFVEGSTKAVDSSQRLVKVSFKTDKESGVKKDTIAVSIPRVSEFTEDASLETLRKFVELSLPLVQDKIVREAVESGKGNIQTFSLDLPAVIEFLEADAKGDRLTKAYLQQWFDSELAEVLTVAIADKLGVETNPTAAQEKLITDTVGAYKEKLSALSGPKTRYVASVCESLQKALGYVTENEIASKLWRKLEEMKTMKEPEADLLAL